MVGRLGLKGNMVFLALVFIVFIDRVNGNIKPTKKNSEDDKKVEFPNRPPIKSIQSEDGDIIDCIEMHKQPAFDHPSLQNHIIQMKPSYDPIIDTTMKKEDSSMTIISQLWQRSGSCPVGTVPIRRIQKRDHLLGANSLQKYGRKSPYVVHASNKTENQEIKHIKTRTSYYPHVNRSDALLITQGYNYIGAKGDINVWNPKVESDDEYSTAQIWLKNGPSCCFESVESGWVVNPSLYGDRRTRLFSYWSVSLLKHNEMKKWRKKTWMASQPARFYMIVHEVDASKETGCFDLVCSGFVQTSHEIALGASIDPVSAEFGPQYDIAIYIYMDTNTRNWWLQYGDEINIGYWPAEILGLLKHSATYVEWGGEVYSSKIGHPKHTATAMGSGNFAWDLFGSASYITHIRILDYSMSLKYPSWVHAYTEEEDCYTALFYQKGYIMEPQFYFGGPGWNPRCP
ncbi:uncharacterized protein LOC122655014 [Telopea speciosissima]|uniref:uncharacterized protein LOC122655014 n=1 Tax=Telopea speciosissima TaxID=54955 RepID=UPI001CC76356|nr:uncharacterized protein LOC122655014 [Telopea speciosissima]